MASTTKRALGWLSLANCLIAGLFSTTASAIPVQLGLVNVDISNYEPGFWDMGAASVQVAAPVGGASVALNFFGLAMAGSGLISAPDYVLELIGVDILFSSSERFRASYSGVLELVGVPGTRAVVNINQYEHEDFDLTYTHIAAVGPKGDARSATSSGLSVQGVFSDRTLTRGVHDDDELVLWETDGRYDTAPYRSRVYELSPAGLPTAFDMIVGDRVPFSGWFDVHAMARIDETCADVWPFGTICVPGIGFIYSSSVVRGSVAFSLGAIYPPPAPDPDPVPEPVTLALLSLGLAGLGLSRRRKA